MRASVGLTEISNFAKYSIEGPGAAQWLDSLLACKLPAIGRMTLAPMLKEDGRVIGDFSLARLDEDSFFIVGRHCESYHMRWFTQHLPEDGSVDIYPKGWG